MLPTPSDAATAARAAGIQPVQIVGTLPPSDRGKGWFFDRLPPDGWDWFHASFNRSVVPADIGANATLQLAGANPFTGQSGYIYLITDWQFHAWRVGAAGEDVPLERNDVIALLSFNLLVDSSPQRMLIFSTGPTAAGGASADLQGFPYLNTRPGPGLQSPQFSVMLSVVGGQRVTAAARVLAVPLAWQYSMIGFEFSGLRVTETAYQQTRRG